MSVSLTASGSNYITLDSGSLWSGCEDYTLIIFAHPTELTGYLIHDIVQFDRTDNASRDRLELQAWGGTAWRINLNIAGSGETDSANSAADIAYSEGPYGIVMQVAGNDLTASVYDLATLTVQASATVSLTDLAARSEMNRCRIGRGGGDNFYGGVLGPMKVWQRALSAQEIRTELRNIRALSRDSLHAEWPMLCGNSTLRPVDFSGHGYDLTENGTISDSTTAFPVAWGDAGPVFAEQAPAASGVTGSGGFALLLPTMAGTGTAWSEITGSGGFALLLPTMAGAGTAWSEITGSGGFALPLPTMTGAGTAWGEIVGSGSFTLLLPEMAGAGTAWSEITGSGGFALPLPTMAGVGSVSPGIVGDGGFTLLLPTMDGSGVAWSEITGSGGFALPLPTMAGVGAAVSALTGSGAFTLPLPTMAGTGAIPAVYTEIPLVAPVRVPPQRGAWPRELVRQAVVQNHRGGAMLPTEADAGDIVYRRADGWVRLARAADGAVLTLVSGEPRWV